MARLAFSKASLHREGTKLKRYKQYLPSLDLKRQQLIAERNKATHELLEIERQIQLGYARVELQLPMMSDTEVSLDGLVYIKQAVLGEENVVGIKLPVLQHLDLECLPYSLIIKPHWVDQAVVELKMMLELQVRLKVGQQRVDALQKAVKKVTQRVNLFDKVLIPRSRHNIAKIRIFLSDAERAAVVRAKITKQKRLKDSF